MRLEAQTRSDLGLARMQGAASFAGGVATLAFIGVLLALTLPAFAGYHLVTVTGGSMAGALPVGSLAYTKSIDGSEVRLDDIVAFKHDGSSAAVIHRVVRISEANGEPYAVTRGDANQQDDAVQIALTGRGERVVFHVPVLGYGLALVQSSTTTLLAIGTVCCTTILLVARRASRFWITV